MPHDLLNSGSFLLKTTPQTKHPSKEELDELLLASKAVLSMTDFQSCARKIFDSCCRVTGATSGYVALLDDAGEENEVLFLESGGRSCTVDPELPMVIRGLRALAYSSGASVYDNNFNNSEWMQHMPQGHVQLDNVLFAPLNIDQQTVGIIGIANKDGNFSERDAKLSTTFGEFAAIALKNSQYLEGMKQSFEKQLSLEKQLQHATKMQAMGVLSASIAHEFNNPLAGITNIIHGIKNRAVYDEEDAELIDMAIRECARLKDLIGSLHDFNRPSSGTFAQMDVHSTIRGLLVLCNHLFNTKKLSVTTHFQPGLPHVHAVADQIKQVLLNLLNNAVDACSFYGTIIIKTGTTDGHVFIDITDDGKGMDAETVQRIFDPFFTTRAEVKGIGLGLSVSYGIIRRHQGKIVVESEPQKGSTFRILLPRRRTNETQKEDTGGR